MRIRVLSIIGAMVLALGLVGVALTLAQEIVPAQTSAQLETDESRREAEIAAAREANPGPALRRGTVFTPPAVISGPVFIGVDDVTQFAHLVNPVSAQNYPLFDGFEIWGAAYDVENARVFIADGVELIEWPLDGAPTALGTITGSVSGASIAMVGLAYADGTLYGVRNITSATEPEGIYTIDTTTLEATLFTTYQEPSGIVDIGGLAADPVTGDLYGTNDGAGSNGLVKIGPNGELTIIAPYPDGQTDVDGLALGDGHAYLSTDQPGNTYVFDFATMTYTTPITNPWTTNEIFAGATWIGVGPLVSLVKTVGTDPNACATTTELAVLSGTNVTYCYEIVNTGSVTLTRYSLVDSELGELRNDVPITLTPSASTFLTQTSLITRTTVNTATLTAYNPGPTDTVTATAAAVVTVLEPSISLSKTVGVDPSACATTTELAVPAAAEVFYCYRIVNTGPITLTRHSLDDSEIGTILTDALNSLAPAATTFITQSAEITQTTVNTATWTAYNPGPTDVVTATATATVTLGAVDPEIGVDPPALAVQLTTSGQATQTLTISNTGTADLEWTITLAPEECDQPGVLLWASATPTEGVTGPGGTSEVKVLFDTLAMPEGEVTGVLCVSSNDADEQVVAVPLSLTVGPALQRMPIITGSATGRIW